MSLRCQAAGGVLIVGLALGPPPARAEPSLSAALFDKAIHHDAKGEARLAFALYRQAADVGLPAAEFNVAVMLDSGRGVAPDLAGAATWYARAAAHGDPRAAYNLGLLYEAGEGVPKNIGIARAWLAASGLAAARERLAAPQLDTSARSQIPLRRPSPVAPAAGGRSDPRIGGVELVWTSLPQSEPARYYVELRAIDNDHSHEVFSSFVDRSSIFAKMPVTAGPYAWRVISVARNGGNYVASGWTRFSVEASPER